MGSIWPEKPLWRDAYSKYVASEAAKKIKTATLEKIRKDYSEEVPSSLAPGLQQENLIDAEGNLILGAPARILGFKLNKAAIVGGKVVGFTAEVFEKLSKIETKQLITDHTA